MVSVCFGATVLATLGVILSHSLNWLLCLQCFGSLGKVVILCGRSIVNSFCNGEVLHVVVSSYCLSGVLMIWFSLPETHSHRKFHVCFAWLFAVSDLCAVYPIFICVNTCTHDTHTCMRTHTHTHTHRNW